MSSWSRLWLAAFAPPVTLFVIGTGWSAVHVFVLGNWDKFGRLGTFNLGVMVIGSVSAAFLFGNMALVWLLRAWIRPWGRRRLLVASAIAATVTLLIMNIGDLHRRVADLLIRVFSAPELPVYLVVLALIPCFVFAATVAVVQAVSVRPPRADA